MSRTQDINKAARKTALSLQSLMAKVEYEEEAVISLLKDLNEFVVSLDQIGKVFHEFGEEPWKEEIIDYLRQKDVLQRLSNIRYVLSDPIPDGMEVDDMSRLEKRFKDIDYWDFKSYLEKTGKVVK